MLTLLSFVKWVKLVKTVCLSVSVRVGYFVGLFDGRMVGWLDVCEVVVVVVARFDIITGVRVVVG